MEKFTVHILGCGAALPTTRHLGSSQVIEVRNKLFMVDCGEGTQLQFRKSKLPFPRLGHLFITHMHGDHCFGLVGLISTLGLLGRTGDLHIYGPHPLQKLLQPLLDFHCQGLPYTVVIHEIDPTQHECILNDHSVEVWSLPLRHHLPCCGYLFREKPLAPHIRRDMIDFYHIPHYCIADIKGGQDYILEDGTIVPHQRLTYPASAPRSYAYCSDTAYQPKLKEWIKGVNLLYHEATFTEADRARAKATLHSTARDAAQTALDTEAHQLVIGHFSARYENEQLLLKEAQELFEQTTLANEKMQIEILPKD